MSTRPTVRRSARASVMLMSASLLVCALAATNASAATPAFHAFVSARQVYVTGLAPSAQMSLVNSAGQSIATQSADSLGGLLFRNVAPGTGYHVRASSGGQQSG